MAASSASQVNKCKPATGQKPGLPGLKGDSKRLWWWLWFWLVGQGCRLLLRVGEG